MKIASAIFKTFKTNSPGIALLLVAGRSWKRATSFLVAFLLKAPDLRLGPGCRVIGGRHISFGKGVYAERNLWLEAVTSYRSQQFHPRIAIGDHVCFSDGVHISSIVSIIIETATIGRGAIVGANSVVRGVVPSNTMVAGAPAKAIKIFNFKTGSWDKA